MVKQPDEIVDEQFNGILSVAGLAHTVTADIVCDYVEIVPEELNLRTPHLLAERKPVNKNYGHARPRSVRGVFDFDVERLESHRYFLSPKFRGSIEAATEIQSMPNMMESESRIGTFTQRSISIFPPINASTTDKPYLRYRNS